MGVARIYKTSSPYPDGALKELDYAQTADVVYTASLDYQPYKATRTAHTSWTFAAVTFGPTVTVPTTPTGVASTPNTVGYIATTYRYKITGVGGDQEQESRASAFVTLTNDLSLSGNYNTLTLPAFATGTTRYVVYKEQGGAYGYIGGTDGLSFVDGNPQLQPVLSDTPPQGENPFNAVNTYPSTVTFHDQRLLFARTRALPNAVWGSQPSDFENFDKSRPTKPDDAISFALVGEKVNSINQLVSMDDLLSLTSNAIYAVSGTNGGALTPSDILPKRQNGRASGRLNPIVIDDVVFYRPNKGSTIRTLGFQFEVDGYKSNNVSIFSPHFFQGFDIIDWAYVEEPYSAIFMVRSDGALLCFTWEAEQQVWGFSLLETSGLVKRVAAISEGGYDRLYALVERTINGVVRRFHERLALPHVDDITAACHLDCSVTQVYSPARNTVGGLHHLAGATVSAYYDGYVAHGLVVSAVGEVVLPNAYAATIATVGLRYAGVIETLPLVLETRAGSAHVNQQNVKRVVVRAIDTRGIEVGITGAELEAVTEREGGEIGLDDVARRDYQVSPPGAWEPSTTITIEQNEPLPAHIAGIFIDPLVSGR